MQFKFRNTTFASMKTNLYLILLLCALLSLFSCRHKPYPHALIAADSLASANPDSAIGLLNSLKEQMKSVPQATQMYYRLLCIKANDKACITHASDSLILSVLHYYIDANNGQHLPEAYYYAGRVYRDLEDAPQALNYFEKAVDALPENGGYKQKGKIYSQMGKLFLCQGMYNEALNIFKKSYSCNKSLKDSAKIIFDMIDLADTYRNINKTDSSLYFCQMAYELGKKLQRQDLMNMVQSQNASLNIQLKRYDRAKIALQDALKDIERPDKSRIYSTAAKLYQHIGKTDSATYYYTALVDSGTIYAQEAAHRSLAEIALENGNTQLAITHLQTYLVYADSIEKITCTENLQRLYSHYNYQLKEKENNRLKFENERKTHYIIYCLIAAVISIVSLFVYYQYSKRKQQELKFQLQRSRQLEEEIYKKNRLFIENNNIRIKNLEKELSLTAAANEKLRKELQDQKELLCHDVRQAQIEQNRREQAENTLQNSDIYKRLKQRLLDPTGKIFITADEWESIEGVLKDTYPHFLEKLSEIYNFKHSEQCICMLIKANFSPSEIAKFTNRLKETITSTRRRLFERIFQKKGKPGDLDQFIRSL